jgi:hypothetical protein
VTTILKKEAPSKIRLTMNVEKLVNEYRGAVSQNSRSKAIIQLIQMGLRSAPDMRFAKRLVEKNIGVLDMKAISVRIDKQTDAAVRSYCGKNGIQMYQAYFDLICTGLIVFMHKQMNNLVFEISPIKLEQTNITIEI